MVPQAELFVNGYASEKKSEVQDGTKIVKTKRFDPSNLKTHHLIKEAEDKEKVQVSGRAEVLRKKDQTVSYK
jgi:hypothetical protein